MTSSISSRDVRPTAVVGPTAPPTEEGPAPLAAPEVARAPNLAPSASLPVDLGVQLGEATSTVSALDRKIELETAIVASLKAAVKARETEIAGLVAEAERLGREEASLLHKLGQKQKIRGIFGAYAGLVAILAPPVALIGGVAAAGGALSAVALKSEIDSTRSRKSEADRRAADLRRELDAFRSSMAERQTKLGGLEEQRAKLEGLRAESRALPRTSQADRLEDLGTDITRAREILRILGEEKALLGSMKADCVKMQASLSAEIQRLEASVQALEKEVEAAHRAILFAAAEIFLRAALLPTKIAGLDLSLVRALALGGPDDLKKAIEDQVKGVAARLLAAGLVEEEAQQKALAGLLGALAKGLG